LQSFRRRSLVLQVTPINKEASGDAVNVAAAVHISGGNFFRTRVSSRHECDASQCATRAAR
jgi:hypothetical protein